VTARLAMRPPSAARTAASTTTPRPTTYSGMRVDGKAGRESRISPAVCGRLTHMSDESFAAVERRIRAHPGEQFVTRSGLPMTYVVDGDRIKVDRAQPWLSMEGARQIWQMGPDAGLADIDQRITGRA
jgi:hypothetical protein